MLMLISIFKFVFTCAFVLVVRWYFISIIVFGHTYLYSYAHTYVYMYVYMYMYMLLVFRTILKKRGTGLCTDCIMASAKITFYLLQDGYVRIISGFCTCVDVCKYF